MIIKEEKVDKPVNARELLEKMPKIEDKINSGA